MIKYSLRRISANEFAKRLRLAETGGSKNNSKEDKKYAFFLGAGCSFTSGIPMAGGLVRDAKADSDWLRRYRDLNAPDIKDTELDDWARRILRTWNIESPASSYGELIELLFLNQGERQREIERLCNGKVPNYGYTVLSSLMSRENGHFSVVLTTNFDDLLAEAFFRFQAIRLMVINHDSLAPFIRPTETRPLLVKLHGDHKLSPRNTGKETETLDKKVAERVATVLHDRGLVFLGYGGNDESILRMLEGLPEEALPFGVYWVSSSEPRGIFRRWLEQRDAVWVEHQDFDDLMLKCKREFEIADPNNEQFERAFEQYQATEAKLLDRLDKHTSPTNDTKRDKAWLKVSQARRTAKIDKNAADHLFRLAINDAPLDASVLGSYAVFLARDALNPDEAENYFRRAIDSDPEDGTTLSNYALFLSDVRKSSDEAERYYRLAIAAEPENANTLSNYAMFLQDIRKTPDEAEKYYRMAIEADPKNAKILGSYAMFLKDAKKTPDDAEKYYRMAIEADPKNAKILFSYAVFLKDVKRMPYEVDKYYRMAIETDPKNANVLAGYAVFLKDVKKAPDEAEKYYRLAIEADPKNAKVLGSYAIFLNDIKRNPDEAGRYFRLAIEADPKNAKILGRYAIFLNDVKKSPNEAEKHFRLAIELDPRNATNLGNFSQLLFEIGHTKEAMQFLRDARVADEKGELTPLAVELTFYEYAHGEGSERSNYLKQLKKLLEDGKRTEGWNFSRNVHRAAKVEKHPAKSWLEKLAAVCNGAAEISTLDKWKTWSTIK
jgi:Tfp pilus assembly protein PilF